MTRGKIIFQMKVSYSTIIRQLGFIGKNRRKWINDEPYELNLQKRRQIETATFLFQRNILRCIRMRNFISIVISQFLNYNNKII